MRAEFPVINEDYTAYLRERYEDTYYPEKILGAGKAVYVERNCHMINKSQFCIIYYQKEYAPVNRKSGTSLALKYAQKKNKKIILLPPITSLVKRRHIPVRCEWRWLRNNRLTNLTNI